MFGRAAGRVLIVLAMAAGVFATLTSASAAQSGSDAEGGQRFEPQIDPLMHPPLDPPGWEEELEAVHTPLLEEFLVTARVVDGSGRPIEGAVVVTAVGGQGVSDADGLVRMRVRMDPAAERLRVTAYHTAGTATRTGSAIAAAAGGVVDAGEIPAVMESGCEPGWAPTVGPQNGLQPWTSAFAVFDDGSGPALFIGGATYGVSGELSEGIVKWTGTQWESVGEGLALRSNEYIRVMAVFDDGSGPKLYIAGRFALLGGQPANSIVRWDGEIWEPVGDGFRSNFSTPTGIVNDLAVFDDGSGPALYAGGRFTASGARDLRNIAKWSGTEWLPVGEGLDPPYLSHIGVNSLKVFDEGDGERLFAAGGFSRSGSNSIMGVARWDGGQWTSVGPGLTNFNGVSPGDVRALEVFDGGNGPELYAAGDFWRAGDRIVRNVARWNGSHWTELNDIMPGNTVHGMVAYESGDVKELILWGSFSGFAGASERMVRWNGLRWLSFPSILFPGISAAISYDDGSGPSVFFAGQFEGPGELLARNIVRWDGEAWNALGSGFDGEVRTLAVHDNGAGPSLYASGSYKGVQGQRTRSIVRWEGKGFAPIDTTNTKSFNAMVSFDDGSGPALFGGGAFGDIGGTVFNSVAKWDGLQWTPLGTGLQSSYNTNGLVDAMLVHDDGGGEALYVGGRFSSAGGVFVQNIAKWDGNSWTRMGSSGNSLGRVLAIAVYDDGSGPALYAGGPFSNVAGTGGGYVAKWNGDSWEPVGGGMNALVSALAVYDAGDGAKLYAAGDFTVAGGQPANRIASWDGQQWAPLGSGVEVSANAFSPAIEAMAVFDDGSGPSLFVGGVLTVAGGQAATGFARWDGLEWHVPSTGIYSGSYRILDMVVLDDELFLAGAIYVPSTNDHSVTRWQACPPACPPDINGDSIVDADDFFEFLSLFAAGDLRADIDSDGIIDADDFFEFLTLFAAGC